MVPLHFSFLFLFLSSWWMGALLVRQSLDILPNFPMSPALYHCHCYRTSVLHNLTHCLEQRPSLFPMLRLTEPLGPPRLKFDSIHIRNMQSTSEFKLAPDIYSWRVYSLFPPFILCSTLLRLQNTCVWAVALYNYHWHSISGISRNLADVGREIIEERE